MSTSKKQNKTPIIEEEEILQAYDNPDQNLLGVFVILLDVAKRTNPEKYLAGYKPKL